jgi:PIN domain nuclease of toxin-antitoxin system
VRVLLDTHALVWMSHDAPGLSLRARQVADDLSNEVLLSVASAWELAIKHGLGKISLRGTYREFIGGALSRGRMTLLPITLDHLERLSGLPPHHRDPFDRLLVAQALAEGVPILSADAALDGYASSVFGSGAPAHRAWPHSGHGEPGAGTSPARS